MNKQRTCPICKDNFMPFQSFQKTCTNPSCCLDYAKTKRNKKAKKNHAKRKREFYDNDRKTRAEAAKKAFHAYVRTRDTDLPCISCGRREHEITGDPCGGLWDCGHYLARGSHPELKYNEGNAHKQCKICNGGAGRYTKKNHTVQQAYKVRLIEKIGLAHVEWLEGPQEPQKLSCEDLKEIEIYYKEKLKLLLSGNVS